MLFINQVMINYQPSLLAGAPPDVGTSINNPILNQNLQDIAQNQSAGSFFALFLPKLLTLGLIIGVLIFFFIIVIGAIQWISSGGDKNALEGARSKITNAIVGIVVLFAVFAVLRLVGDFLGITILTLDIGSLTIQ